MQIYLPRINRTAALVAGYSFGERPTAEVDLAQMNEVDRKLLSKYITFDGANAVSHLEADVPTVEALLSAARLSERQKRAKFEDLLGAYAAAAEVLRVAELTPTKIRVYYDDDQLSGECDGYKLPAISEPSVYNVDGEYRTAIEAAPVFLEYVELRTALEAKRDVLNVAAKDAAKPALLAAREAEQKRNQEAREKAEAEKETRIVERAARRLATGYWEMQTASYNERRFGKPWCANVTGVDERGRLIYAWAEWIGRVGHTGLLRAACKPGDVIACGQKDLRRPTRSEHTIMVMENDGRMTAIEPPEAARLLGY